MPLRNSYIAGIFYTFLEQSILPKLSRTHIHPNHFTLMGFAVAVMVPLGFYFHPLLGFLLILFSGIFDAMDGLLARSRNMASDFGAFLDSSLDRFSDFCFLLGFWVLFRNTETFFPASVLIFASMFFTVFISYIKARALGIGIHFDDGLMDRGARTIYLMVWALLLGAFPGAFGPILWSGLVLFCCLCFLTVMQRLYYVYDESNGKTNR